MERVDEIIKRVQELVEKRGYIPSMAGILLAQNDSGIIGVVINDHEKYEGHVLEDGFISSSLSALSREIDVAVMETVSFMKISVQREERMKLYREREPELLEYTAIFAMSDFYAVELIHYLRGKGVFVPEVISVVGFDDSPVCNYSILSLTTVRQDVSLRAKKAINILKSLKKGEQCGSVKLPVTLVERGSVKHVPEKSI